MQVVCSVCVYVDVISVLLLAVNSIALVKPEKARAVEGMLIQMAQSGQLGRKVYAQCYIHRPTSRVCVCVLGGGISACGVTREV